ncbi:MAG: recombinase family protein, partial [Chloroflexota bacterium]
MTWQASPPVRRDDRKEYQRLIDFVESGGADVIVVQFLDRFGRNPREILRRYWNLEERGVG